MAQKRTERMDDANKQGQPGDWVQVTVYAPYLLAPSWYRGEYPSKRFVTPERQRVCCSVLDLVPTWRGAWHAYPRAKLLMEPR